MNHLTVSTALVALVGMVAGQQLQPRITISNGCSSFDDDCVMTLTEGMDRMVQIELDEPIICADQSSECVVVVNISNSHPHIVQVEPCLVRWEREEWHQTKTVRVTAVQSYQETAEEQRVHLETHTITTAEYYQGFDPLDLFIKSENRRTAGCSANGDPHIRTFDGKYWHFYDGTSRNPSRVTLYRADNREFIIQNQLRGFPARNCGMAGREGPDRVVINSCGRQVQLITDFNHPDSSKHPRVQVSGRKYTVYFHSGAWMQAIASPGYIGVFVQSVDWMHSCGICGNFNGVAADDSPGQSVAWARANSYGALFPCQQVPSVMSGAPTLGDIWDWTYNASEFQNIGVVVPLPQATCPYEIQRIIRPVLNPDDILDITDQLEELADQIRDQNGGGNFEWDDENNDVTEITPYNPALSLQTCGEAINASLTVQTCAARYPAFAARIHNYTQDCAIDYSEMGGPNSELAVTFLEGTVRAMRQDCLEIAISTGDTTNATLLQALCENACSGHGICNASARCECNAGRGGVDCSVDLNAPPTIVHVSDLVFDTAGHQQPPLSPTEILVSGTNFLLSNATRCRFGTVVTNGFYVGPTQIICQVPTFNSSNVHRGAIPLDMNLSVSNNGINWSANPERFAFRFFDSTCLRCTYLGDCGQNPNSCVVGGGQNAQCFLPDQTDPALDNICRECKPNISNSSLSYVYQHRLCRPQYTASIYQHSIVGAASAGDVMLTVDATANPLVSGNPDGYSITYEYVHTAGTGFAPQMFNVHPTTGTVTIIDAIDISQPPFEGLAHAAQNPTLFNGFFDIRATDSQNNSITTSVNIELVPLGFTPIFPQEGFSASVAENATNGASVMVNATHPLMVVAQNLEVDGIDPNSVQYTWHSEPGPFAGALSIDISTGAVTVNDSSKLDFEAPADPIHFVNNTLHYQARATDNATNFLFVIVDIYVRLIDVPEAPTAVFVNDSTTLQVDEGVTGSLGNISTVDPEGGSFTYEIVDATFPNFVIASFEDGTKYLNLITAFDFEVIGLAANTVQLRSTDSTGLYTDSTISVVVHDVDESPHSVSISPLNNETIPVVGNTITLSEDTAVLVDIVEVRAIDPENRPIRCYLPDIALKVRPAPNCEQQTTAQSSNNIIVWNNTLDFETRPTFSRFIVCEDCSGQESELFSINVVVLDANEAPVLTAWNNRQTAPVIEGSTRVSDMLIGTVSIRDDAGSATPSVAPSNPSLFRVTTPSCAVVPSGQPVVCTADVYLLASAIVSYEEYAETMPEGQFAVNLVLSDAIDTLPTPLVEEVTVVMNVADVPEAPTGVAMNATTITEDPQVGQLICTVTIEDQDSSDPSYTVDIVSNPESAFSIAPAGSRRRQSQGGSVWELTVSNPAAFDFETLSSNGSPGALSFTLLITDLSIPEGSPRTLSVTEQITVTDAPMNIISNTSQISGIPGLFGARFSLSNFDRPELASSITWSIASSTGSTPNLNSWGVATATTGSFTDLAVTSDVLLNHADSIMTLEVQATIPAPYGIVVGQFNLRVSDVQLPPVFPTSSYSVNVPFFTGDADIVEAYAVDPDISAVNQRMEIFVGRLVDAPSISNGLETSDVVQVYQVPLGNAYTNRYVTSAQYIAQHDMTSYPSFYVERVDKYSRCNLVEAQSEQFKCAIKVDQAPSQTPVTEGAGVVSSEGLLAGMNGLFVVAVKDSAFNGEDMELAAFVPLSVTYEAQTTTFGGSIFVLGSEGGNDSSASTGVIVGVVILLLLILLVVAAAYFYHQQRLSKARDMFDGKESGMSSNPAYGSSLTDPVPYEQTPFVPGIANPLYDWYQPKMTRKDCTDHLLTQGEGAFVVRDSDANPGWHMLGVKSANEVLHEKIRQTENGEYQLLPSRGAAADVAQPTYATLPELVDHYLKPQPGMPFTLAASNPIYDNHQLAQERTGKLQAAQYDEALPAKNHEYAEAALNGNGEKHGGDSVGNPMYFASGTGANAGQPSNYAAPYLDVNPNQPDVKTTGYLDINPDEEPISAGQGYTDVPATTYGVPTQGSSTGYQDIPSIDSVAVVDPNAQAAI